MKTHTIALVISENTSQNDDPIARFDVLQDAYEIEYLEKAIQLGERQPMQEIINRRALIHEQEDLQADYIEDILCKPFAGPKVKTQGLLWFESKIKLDRHRQAETDAALVIADYAYQIYQNDPSRTDLLLSGPKSQVRVRIFRLANPG